MINYLIKYKMKKKKNKSAQLRLWLNNLNGNSNNNNEWKKWIIKDKHIEILFENTNESNTNLNQCEITSK